MMIASRDGTHSGKLKAWKSSACPLSMMLVMMMMIALPLPAFAALGGDVASVRTDQAHMRAALVRITGAGAYSVHEIQTPYGTLVREYVSTTGTVFAVAWQGPWQPDLRQVLGTYFDHYIQSAQAVRSRRRGRGSLLIQEPGLVVQQAGHPRAFVGSAYDPQLLPQGFDARTIR
jgi:Protein of unknown function (DUF2844)